MSEDGNATMAIENGVGRGSRRRFYTSPCPPAVLQSGGAAVWRCCRGTVAALQGRSWPRDARTFGGAKLIAEPRMCGAQQPRICGKRKPQIRRAHVSPTRQEA